MILPYPPIVPQRISEWDDDIPTHTTTSLEAAGFDEWWSPG